MSTAPKDTTSKNIAQEHVTSHAETTSAPAIATYRTTIMGLAFVANSILHRNTHAPRNGIRNCWMIRLNDFPTDTVLSLEKLLGTIDAISVNDQKGMKWKVRLETQWMLSANKT